MLCTFLQRCVAKLDENGTTANNTKKDQASPLDKAFSPQNLCGLLPEGLLAHYEQELKQCNLSSLPSIDPPSPSPPGKSVDTDTTIYMFYK